MKKVVMSLVAILVMLVYASFFYDEKYKEVLEPIVKVENYRNKDLYKQGNGFIYKIADYAYILTNYHIIKDSNSLYIQIDNKKVKASVLNYDEYDDIAILVIDKKYAHNYLEFESLNNLKKMDKIRIVSFDKKTDGALASLIEPVKFNYNYHNKMLDLIKIKANVQEGDSGSPVIDKNKRVIGIITMVDISNNYSYAIPTDVLIEKIESLEKGEINRINLGIKASNSTENINGVILDEVFDGGLANLNGLKQGDIIVSINDNKVEDVSDFRYYLYKIKSNEKIKIGYYHNATLNEIVIFYEQ